MMRIYTTLETFTTRCKCDSCWRPWMTEYLAGLKKRNPEQYNIWKNQLEPKRLPKENHLDNVEEKSP